jgi:membrane protein YqaA with SNARE-associated domain
MLEDALWLVLAYLAAFAVNLPPAFMPATWMVLAFFRIHYGLPLLALTIGGAFFSTLGRIVLAKGTTFYKRHVMKRTEELDEIGEYLDRRRNYVGVATFMYALLPLPSNSLFIAAGLVEVNMLRVVIGFWLGRALSYTFYVWTTDQVFSNFRNVFERFYSDWLGIALEIAGLFGALALLLVPWPRWVLGWINRHDRNAARRSDA